MARKLLVGGNWKSNGTIASANDLVENVLNKVDIDFNKVEVTVAPISLHLQHVKSILKPEIQVCAQNASLRPAGAFTGEITCEQLLDMGVNWTILGHSERRTLFGETDEIVADKCKRALEAGMSVIACIGETKDERESGVTMDVVTRQLNALKAKITDWSKVAIAYEPVWAIGTGLVATPEQASEVHSTIRLWLDSDVSEQACNNTRIIYGGSVTDENCAEIIAMPDIDGFLVGGASLKPAFKVILEACNAN